VVISRFRATHLDYYIAYFIGGVSDRVFRRRKTSSECRKSCAKVAGGDLSDSRVMFFAAKYSFMIWLCTTGLFLALFLASLGMIEVLNGPRAFDSTPAILWVHISFACVMISMVACGFVIIKGPSSYFDGKRVAYAGKRFGPHPMDFWVILALGIAFGIAV
jgi:hypothetical protein